MSDSSRRDSRHEPIVYQSRLNIAYNTSAGSFDNRCLRPNPISTPYTFPLPLQNKGKGKAEGEGVRGRNGIGPKSHHALGIMM